LHRNTSNSAWALLSRSESVWRSQQKRPRTIIPGFSRLGFDSPRPPSRRRPAQRTVATVPWNLCLDSFEPSPTSDVYLVTARSSLVDSHRLPTPFTRIVSTTRRPPTICWIQACPLGHPEPSSTLVPLAHPEVCEASQRTDACHRANLAVYVSASSSSSGHPPRRVCASALLEIGLSRGPSVLSYDSVSPTTRASAFASRALAASYSLATTWSSFTVTYPEGDGGLGHLRLTATRTRRSRDCRSEFSLRRDAGAVVTPVIIDQCQQPTIHCFQSWAPVVSVHSASRIPRVAVARGPRRLEPVSVSPFAFRGRCLPSLRQRAFRACFVAARVPGGTLVSGGAKPPATMIASTGGARGPYAEAHGSRGSPRWPRPDSLQRVNAVSSCSVRSIFFSRRVLFPPTFEGSSGARGLRSWDREARVSERRRKLLQCFNRPWALYVPLIPASQPVPALLRRGSPRGGSVRTVERGFTARARSGRTPSLLPRVTPLRHFRHRPVILGAQATPTSSEPV